jgi:anti-sigma regulatory factor (Ser/Thr protein kinase)
MPESPEVPLLAAQVVAERTHLVIPSLPHWIEPTVEYLRQKAVLCGACHETRAGKLLVALMEAINNALIHGNLQLSSELKERGDDSFARALAERAADPAYADRMVDILVEYDGETCRWIITDEGQGFDVERVLSRCLSDDPELMLSSGRGILMMHSFLDEICYELGGRRLILALKRASGAEKRREARHPLHLPFRVAPLKADGTPDWSAATDAVSRDFSARGVALIQEGLAEGQRILIGITREGETIYVPAEVRHCRTIATGCVELGCEFAINAPPDPGAEVEAGRQLHGVQDAILDVLAHYQVPAPPQDERRAYPRVPFNQAASIEIEGRAEAIAGYARDLSKGGMAMITRVPVPLAPAVVSLPRARAVPLRVRARVVRCNRIQDGFHDVGLQFVRLEFEPK